MNNMQFAPIKETLSSEQMQQQMIQMRQQMQEQEKMLKQMGGSTMPQGQGGGAMSKNFNPMQSFNLDVNVTSECNLACTYCSEGESCGLSSQYQEKTEMTPEDIEKTVRSLDMDRYRDININWWGGEPFANFLFCKDIMKRLADTQKVCFMFYTNGTYLKKYKKQLIELRDMLGNRLDMPMQSRLHIQVSFDGEPVNTMERRTKAGESEKLSKTVYATYKDLKAEGFSIGIKAVISSRNFKYLFDVWKWHYDNGEAYGPTPDTHSTDPDRIDGAVKEEEYIGHLKDLRGNLMKIVKYSIDHDINLEDHFRWFRKEKQNCASGINYLSIDLDGKTYPCHGCMYRQREDHVRGDLNESGMQMQKFVDETTALYRSYLDEFRTDGTLACNTCTADFCLKCPAGSFDAADAKFGEEQDAGKKWQNHPANHQLCQVWKTLEPVSKAWRTMWIKKNPNSIRMMNRQVNYSQGHNLEVNSIGQQAPVISVLSKETTPETARNAGSVFDISKLPKRAETTRREYA